MFLFSCWKRLEGQCLCEGKDLASQLSLSGRSWRPRARVASGQSSALAFVRLRLSHLTFWRHRWLLSVVTAGKALHLPEVFLARELLLPTISSKNICLSCLLSQEVIAASRVLCCFEEGSVVEGRGGRSASLQT